MAPSEVDGSLPVKYCSWRKETSHSFAAFSGWNCTPKKGRPLRACTTEMNSFPRRSTFVASTCQKSRIAGRCSKSSGVTAQWCECHVHWLCAAACRTLSGHSSNMLPSGSCCVRFNGAKYMVEFQPSVSGPGKASPEDHNNICSKPKHVPHNGILASSAVSHTNLVMMAYAASSYMMSVGPPGRSTPFTRARSDATSSRGAS
mmetsp:Transcript_45194/g.131510  ORF Transcript_45194/g.131510 Transcript_45194/m.131510 type:complete len:202 (+) Transcript_45194:417-1022(+)